MSLIQNSTTLPARHTAPACAVITGSSAEVRALTSFPDWAGAMPNLHCGPLLRLRILLYAETHRCAICVWLWLGAALLA